LGSTVEPIRRQAFLGRHRCGFFEHRLIRCRRVDVETEAAWPRPHGYRHSSDKVDGCGDPSTLEPLIE